MNIHALAGKFENYTLLITEWNHFAYLRLVLYYLVTERTMNYAVANLKRGIKHEAIKSKPGYVCESLFNQTATEFWTFKVKEFIKKNSGNKNQKREVLIEKLEKLIEKSELNDKDYILNFYKSSTVSSAKAQVIYVKPDVLEYRTPLK